MRGRVFRHHYSSESANCASVATFTVLSMEDWIEGRGYLQRKPRRWTAQAKKTLRQRFRIVRAADTAPVLCIRVQWSQHRQPPPSQKLRLSIYMYPETNGDGKLSRIAYSGRQKKSGPSGSP